MNKSDLITLLKSAECGSDELNVAYYEWKYPDCIVQYNKYLTCACKLGADKRIEYIPIHNVSNSVDAALGEIPGGVDYDLQKKAGMYIFELRRRYAGLRYLVSPPSRHKLLTHAILLAVVEAAQ